MKRRKKFVSRSDWPGQRARQEPSRPSGESAERFFVLGRQPLISFAELVLLLQSRAASPNEMRRLAEVAFVSSKVPIDCRETLTTLGGTIKAGKILACVDNADPDVILQALESSGFLGSLASKGKSVTFALSVYSALPDHDVSVTLRRSLTEEINRLVKRILSQMGISCRYLVWEGTCRAEPITSAQLIKTHALEQGAELCLFWTDTGIRIGSTEAVQDIDAFARRDMEKPHRRTTEGMLPPKLARILVNLCRQSEDGVLLDPFCGSGVVLMEAIQLGLNVIGSDTAPDALDASRVNVGWLYENQQGLPDAKGNAFYCCDARRLSDRIAPLSVDCIATEPYLGPPLRRPASPLEAAKLLAGLRSLYVETLSELRILLRPGGRLALVLPRFAGTGHGYGLDLVEEMSLMGYRILNPAEWAGERTDHPYLLYSRQNQRVLREIWLLESPGEKR